MIRRPPRSTLFPYTTSSDLGLRMVAFPAISTGVFGFPKERATRIAVREVRAFLDQDVGVEQVIFVCFSERDFDMYQRVLHMLSD